MEDEPLLIINMNHGALMKNCSILLSIMLCLLMAGKSDAQRLMENLGRGVVAVNQGGGKVFISWRLLGTDPEETAFNLYRRTTRKKPLKLNALPLTGGTNFTDLTADLQADNSYFVTVVRNSKEVETSASFMLPANPAESQYISIPLNVINGYTPNDASAADLDGDGEYEIILHQTGRSADNSFSGYTDAPVFQAYKLNGTLMWTINLGKNIREGAHYTQFIVMDLDGDGKAEFCCKTADGTVDGKNKVIGDVSKDWRNKQGKILDGPEFFTVFNGETGEELATTDYIPDRYPTDGWGGHGGNGGTDNNGNRVDRFVACAAYLDGKLPSVVMCRGYYGRTVLAAWDYRNGKLRSRWVFDTKDGENPFSGQGNHNLTVADVDNDGKDEIIYGSMAVDDDGKGLYTTGLRHGDAIHVSDLDTSRPGLEVFGIHEIEDGTRGAGAAVYDAATGKILWNGSQDRDVGRGVAENIDPGNPGAEMWFLGSKSLLDMRGNVIGPYPGSTNFLIWWDGDLTRELLNGNHIDKYKTGRILTAEGCVSNNGSKSTPVLSADLFGDWREEVIFRTADNKELRIYTTTIPTKHRMYTLMHDPQYRLSIAWQNTGYNQPPHASFYIGEDMGTAPRPNIELVTKTKKQNEK